MARLRVEKVQEAIQHEISNMLLHDVKDPRIQFVTVTGVAPTIPPRTLKTSSAARLP